MDATRQTVKKISPVQQRQIRAALWDLKGFRWEEKFEQNCAYRLDGTTPGGDWLRAKQFTNGTLYLEASQEAVLRKALAATGLAPQTTVKATSASQNQRTSTAPPSGVTVGTDETGKGDYFGPLVVAGVAVPLETVQALSALGVADSKALTAGNITKLAAEIEQCVGAASIATVVIEPARYNTLYEEFKRRGENLNHMLGWAHAQVIQTLLIQSPACQSAEALTIVVDKFGSDHYVTHHLRDTFSNPNCVTQFRMEPRAESTYPAVAAASIVARHQFVTAMHALSEKVGMTLPLGAGAPVLVAGRDFLKRFGRERLADVAKLHFKTTEQL